MSDQTTEGLSEYERKLSSDDLKVFIWPGDVAVVCRNVKEAFEMLRLNGIKPPNIYQYRTCVPPVVINLCRGDRV